MANYPGVTVEKMTGWHRYGDVRGTVVDLPGTPARVDYREMTGHITTVLERITAMTGLGDQYPVRWLAIKLMEGDEAVRDLVREKPGSTPGSLQRWISAGRISRLPREPPPFSWKWRPITCPPSARCPVFRPGKTRPDRWAVRVEDKDGKVLMADKLDEFSEYTMKKPSQAFTVIFDAGEGHQIKVSGKEIF